MKNDLSQPSPYRAVDSITTDTTAPSQEGHAAAPDEALIEEIVEKTARIIAGHKNDLVTKAAVRAALYDLHSRSAGKGAIQDPEGQHYAGEKL